MRFQLGQRVNWTSQAGGVRLHDADDPKRRTAKVLAFGDRALIKTIP